MLIVIFILGGSWLIVYSLSMIEKEWYYFGYIAIIISIFIFFSEIGNEEKPNVMFGASCFFIIAGAIGIFNRFGLIKEQKAREANRPYLEEKIKKRHEEIQREKQRKAKQAHDSKILEDLKKRIELEAMNISINYERGDNRTPIDVSSHNLGYDIKSTGLKETRFIEVKGKSDSGIIQITENEWNKAQELENSYYLYVVYDCPDNPKMYLVQNPANKLKASYDYTNRKYSIYKYEIEKYSK